MPNLCKPYPLQTSECGQQPHSPMESTAGPQVLLGISPDDSDPTEDEMLEQYAPYIIAQVEEIVCRNQHSIHYAVLDLERDELVQKVLIKFWHALAEKRVEYPRAYIKTMVHNEFINMVRQHKPALSLPLDDDGALRQ